MKKTGIITIIFIFFATCLFSQINESYLLNRADIISMSMANVCGSMVDASSSFLESPAQTADLLKPQILLNFGDLKGYNRLFYISASYPTSDDVISIEGRFFLAHQSATGLKQATDAGVNFSKIFTENLFTGIGVKILSAQSQHQTGLSIGLNVGGIYYFYRYNADRNSCFMQNITYSFSLLNIGNPLYADNLLISPPFKIKTGPAFIFNLSKHIQTALSPEIDIEIKDIKTRLGLGMQTTFWKNYKVRFGYSPNSGADNFSFGLGFLAGENMSINYSIVALQNNSYLHYIGIELNSGFFSKKKVKKRVYLKELEKSYPAPLLQSKSKKSSQQPVKNLALSSPKEISQPPVQPVPQPIAEKESPPSQQTISQSPLQRTSLPPVQKLPQSSPEKISQPPVQPAPQSTIQNQIQPIQQKIIKLSNSSRREFTFNSISFIQSNQSIKPILYHYDIEFKYNHYGLNKKAVFVLEKIIPLTRQYSNYHILIEGHTDSRGDSNFNRTLSEQRALSVSKYLLRNGIKKERLSIKGWGSSHPYLPNLNFDGTDSTNGRLKNRRFEITLIKPGK